MMQLSARWESPSPPLMVPKNLKVIYLTNMWVPPHGGIIYPLVEFCLSLLIYHRVEPRSKSI